MKREAAAHCGCFLFVVLLLALSGFNARAAFIGQNAVEISPVMLGKAVADAGKFTVDAPALSWASNKFEYSPATGVLLLKGEGGQLYPIRPFGIIPRLGEKDIEILPFKNGFADSRTIRVRHGFWMSIIDPFEGRLIMGNIGPMETAPNMLAFNQEVLVDGMPRFYTFPALTSLKGRAGEKDADVRRVLFIADAQKQALAWIPFRNEEPESVSIQASAGGSLHFMAQYDMRKFPSLQQQALKSYAMAAERGALKAEMAIEFETAPPMITQSPGLGFLSTRLIPKTGATEALRPMKSNDEIAQQLWLPEATAEMLLAQANPMDSAGRNSAISLIQHQKVETARLVEGRLRTALAGIHGQREAMEALVRLARGRSMAAKAQIAVTGGIASSGAMTSIAAFAKALYPGKKDPIFKLSLANQSEEKFLQTELFGVGAGYSGFQVPSRLMNWLLENEDGGVLVFEALDQAPVSAIRILMPFLKSQQLFLNPPLVEAMVAKYVENKTPLNQWPQAIREATMEGARPSASIMLRLEKNHIIFLKTNAGASLFNGVTFSGVAGLRLETAQQLKSANVRLDGEAMKSDLRARGFEDDFLNLVSSYIPYKALLPEDHASIASDLLEGIRAYFKKEYLIDVAYSREARDFLLKATYSPLDGARHIGNLLRSWVQDGLSDALLQTKRMKAGDSVHILLDPSDGVRRSRLVLAREEGGRQIELGRYEVGQALPAAPTWLLERAAKNLLPLLKKRIRGHEQEKQKIADRILAKLKTAVKQPAKSGGMVLVEYSDGPVGTGKTEIANVAAEGIFENPGAMVKIDAGNIHSIDDFYRMFVEPLIVASRSNPEGLVVLLDEFPRMGGGNPHVRKAIQEMLLSVFGEGVLPPLPDEMKIIGHRKARENAKTPLPKATFFYATGNMIEEVLGPQAEFMGTNGLSAHLLWLRKNPEMFRAAYAKNFIPALRGRIGDPNIFMNLSEEDLAWLRDEKFFPEAVRLLKDEGIEVILGDSAKEYFKNEQIALRGARWIYEKMDVSVHAPLNAWLLGEAGYQGARVFVEFDPNTREMKARLFRQGHFMEERLLAVLPRSRASMHPDAEKRARWATHVHEAGHAVVRRALFGLNSVDRLLTFDGAEGGRTEFGLDAPGHEPYFTTQKGPFHLATFLAGHMAERLFLEGNMSNGAAIDFNHVRQAAQTMLFDGSLFGDAPLPTITDPKTGELLLSNEMRREIEMKKDALMKFSQRLAAWVLKSNALLVQSVSEAMEANLSNFSLSREQFEDLVKQVGIVVPDEGTVRKIALSDRATHRTCRELLLGAKASFSDKLLDFILRRR